MSTFSPLGKISAQPHTIVKQICFLNGNVLFLSLFSLSKNWMHNEVWGCAEILPPLDHVKVKCPININQCTFYIDVSQLWLLCEMTTKNCANGPNLVLKDLCDKSFVRNDRLPSFRHAVGLMYSLLEDCFH